MFPKTATNSEVGHRFNKYFTNWPLTGYETLNLTFVETYGHTIDDFINNATVYLEDWHGNQGPDWNLADLPRQDYDAVEQMFLNYLDGK